MTSVKRQLTTPNKKGHECVLLIVSDVDAAARVLGELGSVTEERFQVEWVTELSRGIERLCDGGVGAAVLDLNLHDSKGVETFDKVLQAAPGVPILILSEVDSEAEARQAVERGAHDYLLKEQADGYRLRRTVRKMIDHLAAEAVYREEAVATITLDAIGAGVVRTDTNGNVTYLNGIAERMSGWFREEALGRSVADVLRLVDSASGAVLPNAGVIVAQGDERAEATTGCTNCTLVRRDGFECEIENRVTFIQNQDGNAIGSVISFRDVSEARADSLEMARVAQHDDLTHLPNRTLLDDRLTQAISLAERQHKQLAVLFVDVDQFKRINDTLGHAVGDNVLRSIAGRLTACIRRADTVSRLGGDEFLVLLSQVEHAEDAALTARKILRAIASPHIIDNKSLDINVSIGSSTYPADGQDAESLVHQADIAMYEAKQLGRNRYQSFRTDMTTRLAKRLLLEADLRSALGRNEFLLHYQPKINLQTGQVTGMEALIRWQHPERGMLLPAAFVPIAEECGLIVRIGQWVLVEACRQAREWSNSGMGDIPISVNVSAVEFQSEDFLSGVRAALITTGMEPQNLELELTETVLMKDAESAVVLLLALKTMGVRLAIDDFGTGYSSFTYLRRFTADTLKVGQLFVQEITADPEGSTLVSAMISIGKILKQRVIAVGVENASQFEFLQRHGCGEGQGSYFSHPVVAEQAARLFKSGMQKEMVHCSSH